MMILIGERINAGFDDIAEALKNKEAEAIKNWAKKQARAGADYLDLNMGAVSKDPEDMVWLANTVGEAVETGICIDSQRPDIVEAGLENFEGKLLINSTTATDEKMDSLMPLATKYDAGIIGVTSGKGGSPQDVNGRLEHAATIFSKAMELGLDADKLFLDPVTMPLKFMQNQASNLLEAIRQLKKLSDPPPHISLGISNISSEAKEKSIINRTFLVMAMAAGLDTAICDVTDEKLMDSVATAEIILNNEIYSDSYLDTYRME